MIRSLWLVFLYVSFLGLGAAAPFVMTLGYVWVDTFQPQAVAYFILNQIPVAMIMGAGAFGSYFLLDRRSPPPMTLQSGLQIFLAVWMTLSLVWSEVPSRAWEKWDWAFKSMVFAAFVPLVIRSRVQIEAFAQTYVFSLAANFIPFGIKVMISGGGYGQNLGLQSGNSGLAEGGLLSTICLMAAPVALYLGAHGQLIPRLPMIRLAYLAVAAAAVITAIGTQQRSALVGLVFLILYQFVRSRRKFVFGILIVIGAIVAMYSASDTWTARMQTARDYKTENSALVRVLVWEWTLNYSLTHPLGGGFEAYAVNTIIVPPDPNNPGGSIQHGRAFHSIYFEMLGEMGYPGLFAFLICLGSTVTSLIGLSRKCRKIPDLAWVADMSDAVQAGIIVFMASGAFVGIAFQPPIWYFVSMGICLRAFVWRVESMQGQGVRDPRLEAESGRAVRASGPAWGQSLPAGGRAGGRWPA